MRQNMFGGRAPLGELKFLPQTPCRIGWPGNGTLPSDSSSADKIALQLKGELEGDGEKCGIWRMGKRHSLRFPSRN